MKLLVRFFLSLCIFLLNGNSQLCAHAHHGFIHPFSTPDHVHLDVLRHKFSTVIKPVLPHKKKAKEYICVTDEEEEDNFVPFKKRFEVSNYFTDVFGAQMSGYFCGYVKKRLLCCQQFSHFLSDTYLRFRAIRI